MCGTYSSDKYCGSWPRESMPARPAFSTGFPPQPPPGWPGPTQEYRMAILVPFIRVLPYSTGTGLLVSSPVLCIAGTGIGRLPLVLMSVNQNIFLKALRSAINLVELYCDRILRRAFKFGPFLFWPVLILFCPRVGLSKTHLRAFLDANHLQPWQRFTQATRLCGARGF